MGDIWVVLLLAGVIVVGGPILGWRAMRTRRLFTGAVERATYRTLHRASLATPGLRAGLTPQSAQRAARHLRGLLGVRALAMCDGTSLLAWDGTGSPHASVALVHSRRTFNEGRTHVVGPYQVACADPDCPIRAAVVAPLQVQGRTVGTLAAYTVRVSPGLVRATDEVAQWVSTQLELAELDDSRTRLIEADLAALRSQISPHFVYNALTAIASFVRTDPERARELLLAFAEHTRYALRQPTDFTTLAEELRSVDQYLELERARFGARLQVTLLVAPGVLPVAVPFLCLQPLVENAVRHGLEGKAEVGHVRLRAQLRGAEVVITVEDDGVGMEPERARAVLAGEVTGAIGLVNVDARMRRLYGPEHGLLVRTGPGRGTCVSLRVPSHPAVARAA